MKFSAFPVPMYDFNALNSQNITKTSAIMKEKKCQISITVSGVVVILEFLQKTMIPKRSLGDTDQETPVTLMALPTLCLRVLFPSFALKDVF